MNRRNIFGLSAIAALGLALLPGNAIAQQKSLKDQLVGVWTLVSAEAIDPDGTRMSLVKGADVKGLEIFTDSGRVSFQVIGSHPNIASKNRMKMTPDDMKAMAESILSYFGTYTVDEAEKSFTVQIESSSFSNQIGTPGKRTVALAGDEMTVTNGSRIAGGQTITVWKRSK